MNNRFLLLAVFAISIFSSFSKKADSYNIDLNKSKIEWTGRKVTGAHTGEIKIAGGQLNLKGGKLNGGKFEINMNTITTTDLSGTSATKLLGHLKSDDFFSTDKNPRSQFVITNVKYKSADNATITGNLTIKGITHTLSFPANIKQKANTLVAVANSVMVDRTKYEIKYGSKNFLTGLGDKAIDDNFELNIIIVADRK